VPIKYNSIKSVLQAIFLVKTNPAGHLYFLPLLFFTILLFTLLEIFFKKRKILLSTCIIISSLAYLLWGDIYLSINPLKGIGFYALGYTLRESSFYKKLYNFNSYTFLFLILFLTCIIGYTNNSKALIKHILAYSLHIFSALAIYQISINISRLKSGQFIKSNLINIGKYSFDIYLLHEPYIVTVFFTILVQLSVINVFMNQLILFVLGILIPFLVSSLWLRKIKIYRQYFLGLFT